MFYGVFDGTMVILDDFGVISEYVQNTCKTRAKYVFYTYPRFMRTRGVFSRTNTRTKYVFLGFQGISIFGAFERKNDQKSSKFHKYI